MRSTQVRLLTLAQVIILISTSLPLLTQTGKVVKRDDDILETFLETPIDVEYTNQKEIDLDCRYSVPIRKCVWYKDDRIVRWKNEWHVRFEFNESQGICNIAIRRPQMGIDTSKWKCQVVKLNGNSEVAPEIVIYAINVPRTSYFDNSVQYELMHMSQTHHRQATVHLEMLTMYETRIRWYVDGDMVEYLFDEKIDLLKVDSTRVFSSTTVDLSKLGKGDFKVVQCCVEFKSKLKQFKIFTVYVTSGDFDTDYRLAKENVVPQLLSVKQPKPFLIIDGKEMTDNHAFLRFEISNPTLHEIRFVCGDMDAFPSSVLMWQAITTEVEAASDMIEFNRTEQALEESETISLHAIFKNPNSKIMIACHAFNILAPKKYHQVAQAHISLKYVAPACASKKQSGHLPTASPKALAKASNVSVSSHYYLIIICFVYVLYH